MDINEINKCLKQLKEAMGVVMENTTHPQYAEVQPHFEGLIKYYEGLANEIAEKNANKGALTINDLNQKYRRNICISMVTRMGMNLFTLTKFI